MPKQHPSQLQAPITWADLLTVHGTHGVRPFKKKGAKSSRPIRRAYRMWIAQQGIRPSRDYVMPIDLLTGTVRQVVVAETGRRPDRGELRALIVDALNDPDSGLQITPRPFQRTDVVA